MEDTGLLGAIDALETGLVVVDPFDVALFSLAGVDHRETLQRLVTQDVLALRPGEGRLSLLLAPKGQFRALMGILARESEALLVAPPGRGDELVASLGKYLALSRSSLSPLTVNAMAIIGPRWPEVAKGTGADAGPVEAGGWTGGAEGKPLWMAGSLLALPGALIVASTAKALMPATAELGRIGALHVGADVIELERIRTGRPAWGRELTATVLPPEAGIGDEAISHTKGCYVGQETMARLRTYGHLNRGLVGVVQEAGRESRPEPPEVLRLEGEERPVGELTSWAWHPRYGGVGLAIVRSRAAQPGTLLVDRERRYRIAPLPLW